MYRTRFLPAKVGVFASLSITLVTASIQAQQPDPNAQLRPRVVSSTKNTSRDFGGWQPAQPQSEGPVTRASYYQQFSDMPNLNGASAAPSLPADSLVEALNDLRPVPPQRNLGASLVQPTADRMSEFNSQAAYNQEAGYGAGAGNYGAPNLQQSVMPNNRIPANLAAFQNGQPSVLPGQNGAGQFNAAQQPGQFGQGQFEQGLGQGQVGLGQFGQGQVYPTQNGYPAQNGNPLHSGAGQPQFASGLPYVTAAPGQRYPTSPYMGPRNLPIRYTSYQRNVAYQQPVNPAVLPQNVQPPVAPIYNPNNPGIYPTNYQCADGAAGAYVPPTYTPNWNPSMYSANNNGYKPLFSLGQENYNVQLGRGLYGQPTVYVPGQPFRNFFRYIFP